MSGSFDLRSIIDDLEFLFDGAIPPDLLKELHAEGLTDLNRLADADVCFFVIGNYDDPQKRRVEHVRDQLSVPTGDEAFILEEIDPAVDRWENFYVKFRVLLARCDYVVGVFEDNDGGHVLELGEVPLEQTYVLKRDYQPSAIDGDLEREKFDAMVATLFDLLDRRDQLYTWTSESELVSETWRIGALLGHATPPENR